MALARLTLPEPLDLVPADDVREIIAATDRDLAALEQQASEAEGSAEQAEARAADARVDGRASAWAMVRMQRFLDSLRAEVDDEIATMLDVARERARLRVEGARQEARQIRYGASSAREALVAPMPEPAPMPAPPPVPEPPIAAAVGAPPVSEALVCEPIVYSPVVVHAPVVVGPPIAVDPPVTEQPVAEQPVVEQPIDVNAQFGPASDHDTTVATSNGSAAAVAPFVPASVPAMFDHDEDESPSTGLALEEAHTIVAPAVGEAVNEEAAPSADEFWPEPAPRRRGLRRIPLSAVLEVIAVLLILVFILLRLS